MACIFFQETGGITTFFHFHHAIHIYLIPLTPMFPLPPYSTQCDPRTRTNPRCHPLTGEAPPFLARRQPHRVCSNLLLLLLPPTATINIIITITVTNITITITSTTSAQGTPIVFQQ